MPPTVNLREIALQRYSDVGLPAGGEAKSPLSSAFYGTGQGGGRQRRKTMKEVQMVRVKSAGTVLREVGLTRLGEDVEPGMEEEDEGVESDGLPSIDSDVVLTPLFHSEKSSEGSALSQHEDEVSTDSEGGVPSPEAHLNTLLTSLTRDRSRQGKNFEISHDQVRWLNHPVTIPNPRKQLFTSPAMKLPRILQVCAEISERNLVDIAVSCEKVHEGYVEILLRGDNTRCTCAKRDLEGSVFYKEKRAAPANTALAHIPSSQREKIVALLDVLRTGGEAKELPILFIPNPKGGKTKLTREQLTYLACELRDQAEGGGFTSLSPVSGKSSDGREMSFLTVSSEQHDQEGELRPTRSKRSKISFTSDSASSSSCSTLAPSESDDDVGISMDLEQTLNAIMAAAKATWPPVHIYVEAAYAASIGIALVSATRSHPAQPPQRKEEEEEEEEEIEEAPKKRLSVDLQPPAFSFNHPLPTEAIGLEAESDGESDTTTDDEEEEEEEGEEGSPAFTLSASPSGRVVKKKKRKARKKLVQKRLASKILLVRHATGFAQMQKLRSPRVKKDPSQTHTQTPSTFLDPEIKVSHSPPKQPTPPGYSLSDRSSVAVSSPHVAAQLSAIGSPKSPLSPFSSMPPAPQPPPTPLCEDTTSDDDSAGLPSYVEIPDTLQVSPKPGLLGFSGARSDRSLFFSGPRASKLIIRPRVSEVPVPDALTPNEEGTDGFESEPRSLSPGRRHTEAVPPSPPQVTTHSAVEVRNLVIPPQHETEESRVAFVRSVMEVFGRVAAITLRPPGSNEEEMWKMGLRYAGPDGPHHTAAPHVVVVKYAKRKAATRALRNLHGVSLLKRHPPLHVVHGVVGSGTRRVNASRAVRKERWGPGDLQDSPLQATWNSVSPSSTCGFPREEPPYHRYRRRVLRSWRVRTVLRIYVAEMQRKPVQPAYKSNVVKFQRKGMCRQVMPSLKAFTVGTTAIGRDGGVVPLPHLHKVGEVCSRRSAHPKEDLDLPLLTDTLHSTSERELDYNGTFVRSLGITNYSLEASVLSSHTAEDWVTFADNHVLPPALATTPRLDVDILRCC